jgi:hypothetical protein
VAAVDTIKVADGQGASRGDARVVEPAKYLHREPKVYLVIFLIAIKSQAQGGVMVVSWKQVIL